MTAFVEEVCEAAGFQSGVTLQVQLAVEEAVVNVMKYAYLPDTHGHVTVEAQLRENSLTFILMDSGKPFDPTTVPEPVITLSATQRAIGGLGMHLVRQIMDSVTYAREDHLNVLTLVKERTRGSVCN